MEALIEETLPLLAFGLSRGAIIFIIALSVVYLFGRMLNFAKTYRQKNAIAFLTMLPTTHLVILNYGTESSYLFTFVVLMSFGILLYVLIGFKLYSRVDHALDKKIGED